MIYKPKGDNFGLIAINKNHANIYRSGRMDYDTLQKLNQHGLKYMINLRDNFTQEEEFKLQNIGIASFNYPMSDSKTPDDKVLSFIPTILYKMNNSLISTLVCCEGGRHRTGLIAAIYLVAYKNMSKEEAWKINVDKFNWYDRAFGIFGKDHSALRKWFFKYPDIKSLRID